MVADEFANGVCDELVTFRTPNSKLSDGRPPSILRRLTLGVAFQATGRRSNEPERFEKKPAKLSGLSSLLLDG